MRRGAIVAVGAMLAGPVAADPLLETLAGDWRGSGVARSRPGAPPETIRCRIANSVNAAGRLDMAGKCAVPGRSATASAFVEPVPGVRTYRAEWSNPFGAGTLSLRGRPDGDAIRFTFLMRHPDTDERLRGTMVWTIGESSFDVRTSVTPEGGGPAEVLGEMTFAR